MKSESRNLDWTAFWLFEVILLSIPILISVIALRADEAISPQRAGVLLVVLIGLTVVNLVVNNLVGRSRPR